MCLFPCILTGTAIYDIFLSFVDLMRKEEFLYFVV